MSDASLEASMLLGEDLDPDRHVEISYSHTTIDYTTNGFYPLYHPLTGEYAPTYNICATIHIRIDVLPQVLEEIEIVVEV